ncbi:uncharacterized protein [Dipodomys merriami]|uniref:uncharacterized protein n=1 Tax=Dipodomys merriami TaxID=94247 RepID=UPI0038559C64
MGCCKSRPREETSLDHLPRTLDELSLTDSINKERLTYCSEFWPQNRPDNRSQWLKDGNFDYTILRDLDGFCHRNGKWPDVVHIQASYALQDNPTLCQSCPAFPIPPEPVVSDPLFDSAPLPAEPSVPSPPSFSLPSSPSLLSLPAAHTRTDSRQPPPNSRFPLPEVAGPKGILRVHAPFSIFNIAQIEKQLGSYSQDSKNYIKQFKFLALTYDLSWHDIYLILSSTLTAEEKERVWTAAQAHADEAHRLNNDFPVGATAVPREEPNWNDQSNTPGKENRSRMITCLVAGLEKAAYHYVNYDKLNYITQRPNENPAEFLERLTVALQRYTKLDPESAEAKVVLNIHFIAQSAPDIRKRLKKAEDGPQTPQRELVKMAFKVFNNREEQKIANKTAHKRENYEILAAAIRRRGTQRKPPGPCFKCGQEGHWAKACPSPQPPPGPCPRCGQKGHWGVDCPSRRSLPGPKGMVVSRRTSHS